MTESLRELLLRRLNQAFWLVLLMSLAGWGAWRFSGLAIPDGSIARQTNPPDNEFRRFHLQSISSLDSSVTVLRLAVMTGQSETVLLNLTEQIRQQAQEVTLLSSSKANPLLLDQCLEVRQLLIKKASVRSLSQRIAVFQSQVRHLQYRVAGN